MGSWLFFLLGVRGEDLGIADLSGCRRSGRRSFSISHKDSDSIAECVSIKVKEQHDNTYHGVKTLARRLCSIRARSFTSPHIRAPLPLHCLCDSERAASMGCGQTSTDRQQGCVLRCPGEQAAAVRSRDYTDIGATDPASSPRGMLPQGQQTPPSRTSSARGVSAISAGVPRFDCSTRLWLQDWSCIKQGGVQYWLQGSRASRCSDNNIAPTEQSTSSAQ